MEFGRGMAQQMSEVAETLGVLQTEGFSAEADGPISPSFAEDALLLRNGRQALEPPALEEPDRALHSSPGI